MNVGDLSIQGGARCLVLAILAFLSYPLANATELEIPEHLDQDGFLNLLNAGEFKLLNQRISAYQQAYAADTEKESDLLGALAVFSSGNPSLDRRLDEWIEKYPDSYGARIARAYHKVAQGWNWRGTAFANKTPELKFARMREAFSAARSDLITSLELTEKPVASYALLIGIGRATSDREILDYWLTRALESDPLASAPRWNYSIDLMPRWGGSHQEMQAFADAIALIGHPKLIKLARKVEAQILLDKGDERRWADDLLGALELYQAAHRHVPFSSTNEDLGRLYKKLGRDDHAEPYLKAALEDWPHDESVMASLAHLYLRTRNYDQAMHYLRSGAFFMDDWSIRQLATINLEGKYGQAVDNDAGVRLLELGAYLLDKKAIFTLGNMYEKGLGVPVDRDKAIHYYEIGVALGDGASENNLGLVLWYRNETPDDRKRAARLWKSVADKGLSKGQINLDYFLSPAERLALAANSPQTWPFWPWVGIAALLLLLSLVFFIIWRHREASDRYPGG